MSTYNGEKYLREQIDSILNQTGVLVHLLVRDDGSSDGTTEILNSYSEDGKLDWYTGRNKGAALCFKADIACIEPGTLGDDQIVVIPYAHLG